MEYIVYVVHCVDTEGPLYESIEATFERLKKIFNLEFNVDKETLKKLQKQEIDLNGIEDEVANLVSPNRLNNFSDFEKIKVMLKRIMSENFRKNHLDSFGNKWIYNWFTVDHVGYTGINPRRRILGHHKIYDLYKALVTESDVNKDDLIQWHYHPLAPIRDANRSGSTYLNSSHIFDILNRKVIDREWFPTCFRPGFHVERVDSNWFLEQWIPFDYANQSVLNKNTSQPDQEYGRLGNWSSAPKSWIPYNPDFYDYQKKGDCKRYIARCLNMEARHSELTNEDIKLAFSQAQELGKSLLAFTNHDFRDMVFEIDKIYNMIINVSKEFPNVKFKYVNAIKGMREVLDIKDNTHVNLELDFEHYENKDIMIVKSKNEIFGVQPFFAIKTKSDEYFHENLDIIDKDTWAYTFDYNSIELELIDIIGLAANSNSGITQVVQYNVVNKKINKTIYNQF
ncbi:conserved hypothetical protein [Candidatus Magnetomoraceae bacterium gMMP-1]